MYFWDIDRMRFRAIGVVSIAACLWIAIALILPDAIDWQKAFGPATEAFLSGGDPYAVKDFFNPPWVLPLLVPFALLPEPWDRASLLLVSVAALAIVLKYHESRPWASVLFLSTPMSLVLLLNGNIDAFVFLGLCVPLPIAAPLLLIKPQVGLIPFAFLAYYEMVTRGWRKTAIALTPLVTLAVLSFLIYGNWAAHIFSDLHSAGTEQAIWPLGLPAGLVATYRALREKKIASAYIASPLLSPHVGVYSWLVVFLLAVKRVDYMALIWIGSWAAVFILGVR